MTDGHIHRQKFILLLLDILAILTAFAVAMHLRFNAALSIFEPGNPPWQPMLQSLPILLIVWVCALSACGAYETGRKRIFFELARIVQALAIVTCILLSVTFFYRGFSYSRGFTILFLPMALVSTFAFRVAFRIVRAHINGLDRHWQGVLLVGNSVVAQHFAERTARREAQLKVLGVLDDETPEGTLIAGEVRIVGRVSELAVKARELGAHGVVVTSSKINREDQLALLDICLANNLEWQLVPSAYELMLDRVTMEIIDDVPVLGMRRSNIRGVNRFLKRMMDMVIASLALMIVAPLMMAVALLIKLKSKGPVFFHQDRVGEQGRVFRFRKFRTMHVNNDDAIHRAYARTWIEGGREHVEDEKGKLYKIKGDPRIIPGGAFLRKYSIDELPQLFNVLAGEMSLIGPRPPIPYEVEIYREWHRRRSEGPPGITGLWQVSGRNRLSFDEMVTLDIQYLENWSVWQDLRILWRTMGVVLFDRAY